MTVLAELLNQRKAAFEALNHAQAQIVKTAVVEEPDLTPELRNETADLLETVRATVAVIRAATIQINQGNNRAEVTFEGSTMSLMEAIAVRDNLNLLHKQQESILEGIESALGLGEGRRHSYYRIRERRNKDEIKEVAALDLKEFREHTRGLASRVRLLDIEIQKVNWSFQV